MNKFRFALGFVFSALVSLPLASVGQTLPPKRVLFVGNSYTHYNNLPGKVAEFFALANLPLATAAETKGGARRSAMMALRSTQYQIKNGRWDVVVLQEHSTLPLVSPDEMLQAVQQASEIINASGAKPLLYMTWARVNRAYDQAAISAAYVSAAAATKSLLAPVGQAWALSLASHSKLHLHNHDGSHPSPAGTYLTACSLFLALVPKAKECPALALQGMSEEDTRHLREAARLAQEKYSTPRP